MNEKTEFPFWTSEWMEAQQHYWDAMSAFMQSSPGEAQRSPPNPWAEAIEGWRQVLQAPTQGIDTDFFVRMLEQGKAFFQVTDQFSNFLKQLSQVNQLGEDWQNTLRSQFDEVKKGFEAQYGSGEPFGGLSTFWNLPLDTWKRTVSSASLLPGDFLETFKPGVLERATEKFHGSIEQFLSVPAVGYTRESQEQVQEFARLCLNYQRALQEYTNAHSRLGAEAFERLFHKVIEKSQQQQPIASLRELYDLWVDCGEEAYNEFVFTDEYAELYGRMVNSLMALKHHGRNQVDEVLGALGVPTRQGFDTLQERQQELRRQMAQLRAKSDGDGEKSNAEAELRQLREEVKALRGDLAMLKAPAAASSTSAPPPRTPRKRASTGTTSKPTASKRKKGE